MQLQAMTSSSPTVQVMTDDAIDIYLSKCKPGNYVYVDEKMQYGQPSYFVGQIDRM